MGPASVTAARGLDVGPHPHCGLQTLTWLTVGEALHHDSLGTEQVIRPGQLNLMTAGGGVAHAEEATGQYEGTLEGVQLWVALPERTRHGPGAFAHLDALPQVELANGTATVIVGDFAGASSPARHDTALVGVDLDLRGPTTIALEPGFEYGLIVLDGALRVGDQSLTPGHLGYLDAGPDEVAVEVAGATRAILLGGEPFDETPMMWWNFVARTREEIDAAYASWAAPDGRFGEVSSLLARVETPPPAWGRDPREARDAP